MSSVENIAGTVFNINLVGACNGEDVQDVVENIMQESKRVLQAWDTVTRKLENSLASNLLKLIIKRWVSIRTNALTFMPRANVMQMITNCVWMNKNSSPKSMTKDDKWRMIKLPPSLRLISIGLLINH